MRDDMSTLFSERFQGHESPVDQGVWDGIQQQLAVSAGAGEDSLTDLFKERFQGHETAVDPSVWQAVSSQLGHTAAAGTASTGILGWAAAGTAVVIAGIAGYLFLSDAPASNSIASTTPVTEQVDHIATSELDVVEEDLIVDASSQNAALQMVPTDPQPVSSSSSLATHTEKRDPAPLAMAPLPATPAKDLRPALDPVDQRAQEGSARVESIIEELTTEVEKDVKTRPEPVSSEVTLIEPVPNNTDASIAIERLEPLPELYIPNTFTPNGDGINDRYEVEMSGFRSLLLRVYSMTSDRLVFSTNSGEPWTGEGCADGMYMVAVEAVTKDGRTVSEGKVVWLTRERVN